MSNIHYDLAIVGYGPVGQLLALTLGKMGYRIVVYERWSSLYPLPRAVFHDHEIHRIFKLLGLESEISAISHASSLYQWFNAEWKILLEMDWGQTSISGGPYGYFCNQPELEAVLDRQVKSLSNVTVHQGYEVTQFSQQPSFCQLTVHPVQAPLKQQLIQVRYLVGADGANSTVRQLCGIGVDDLGFAEDWLVVDVKPRPGVTLKVPMSAQWCNPARPTTIVPGGPGYRRWEFMRLPSESPAELENEERVWQLLAPWVSAETSTLVRFKLYHFRSRIARDWCRGRVLLAGDAAHQMPPFMGQGMCSGLRDAWNLSWRLARVLNGTSENRLLQSYTLERYHQVRQVIESSIALGRELCMTDHQQAQQRDNDYFSGSCVPPAPFPGLMDGIIYRGPGAAAGMSGKLFVHGELSYHGRCQRFDRFFGYGFHLILGEQSCGLLECQATTGPMALIGGQIVVFTDDPKNKRFYLDSGSIYTAYFKQHQVAAVLVRPDFYVYGAVERAEDVPLMLNALLKQLALPASR